MITITSPTFDPLGIESVDPIIDSSLQDISRRANRIQTLDGGATANDAGFSHADRTLAVVFPYTDTQFENLSRMVRLYPRLIVSTQEGVFNAIPERLQRRQTNATLTLLIMEKLSA
ncbi:hypothetical protein [Marinobacterium litorale]|uniref:hypothetical protein n=1 Tax=Marinobacterium litorale TaxID=404770 RepID=UPI0003FE9BB6|nr:hypothetical protein [Marinobacterium litorale]